MYFLLLKSVLHALLNPHIKNVKSAMRKIDALSKSYHTFCPLAT